MMMRAVLLIALALGLAGCASTGYIATGALGPGRTVAAEVSAPPADVFASARELAAALYGDAAVAEDQTKGRIQAQSGEKSLSFEAKPENGRTLLFVTSEGSQTVDDDHDAALKAIQSVCADLNADCRVRR